MCDKGAELLFRQWWVACKWTLRSVACRVDCAFVLASVLWAFGCWGSWKKNFLLPNGRQGGLSVGGGGAQLQSDMSKPPWRRWVKLGGVTTQEMGRQIYAAPYVYAERPWPGATRGNPTSVLAGASVSEHQERLMMRRSLFKAMLGHKHTLKQQSEGSLVLPLN